MASVNPMEKETYAKASEVLPGALCRVFSLFFWTILFVSFLKPLVDPDMWTHLKAGEYICHHGLPAADVFSYTVFGKPWLNHEWLSQVLLWGSYRLGGCNLLIFVPAFLSLITLGFVYHSCAGSRHFALYVTLLVWATYSFFMCQVRPYLFTFLFTAIYVYILEAVKSRRVDSRWFFLFPAIMLFWVNLHGAYVAGLAILILYALGEWLGTALLFNFERNLGQEHLRKLVLAIFFCVGASFCNPFGFHLLIYPFLSLAGHAHLMYVSEWQSPSFHTAMFWPFLLVFSGGLLVCAMDRKRPDLTEVILFLSSGLMGFYSVRHIPFFAIVSAPIVSRHGWDVLMRTRCCAYFQARTSQKPRTLRKSLTAVFFASVAIISGTIWATAQMENNGHSIERVFPVAAVNYIKKRGLDQERIFNDYDWGGYLIWRGIPVFIDGRGEVYKKGFITQYMKILNALRPWRKILNDYQVQYVLLKRERGFASVLAEATDWERVYQDDIALLFVRRRR